MELWCDEFWDEAPEIYNLKDVCIKPVILRNVLVIYPHDAIKKKLSGKVVIKVVIDEKGFVIDADIYKGLFDTIKISHDSSGTNEFLLKRSNITSSLDMASLEAAKKARFEPAWINGRQVKSIVHIPFTFVAK